MGLLVLRYGILIFSRCNTPLTSIGSLDHELKSLSMFLSMVELARISAILLHSL